jgi:two-component system, NarL family, nitrate/nitrite response regulator NarL
MKGATPVKVLILTPIRILGEGLHACLSRRPEFCLVATVPNLPALREALKDKQPDLVLIDVTQGIDLEEVRSIAAEHPDLALVALGLCEQRQEVIRCGRAGFVGYVAREATVDILCKSMLDIATGRLHCSAEISGGLLRALFQMNPASQDALAEAALTRREGEVLQLIGRGLTNKEIARELHLSTATIKHHVHGVLEKLQVPGRAQAMRRVRETPWMVPPARPVDP